MPRVAAGDGTAAMIAFTKMHGLGNDFVVIDGRDAPVELDVARLRAIADRRRGVGCDQVVLVEPARNEEADAALRFHNADGGEAAACGNGTRCAAALLMRELGRERVVLETAAGRVVAQRCEDGRIRVDMGPVRTDWRDIPLAEPADTIRLDLACGPLAAPVAVNVGNPHCVFFVEDVEAIALEALGPQLERHPMFPERTNVEVASVLARDRIRLRVWERGSGITQACGTGACATLVAAHRRGLAERRAEILLDGGRLEVAWREDGHVELTGPAAVSFTGCLAETAS